MTFDFTVPITWADIISVISTLVALVAVIVAIVANCKSSKSLKYSLKMQEQSKNIDLFEKRVSVIDEIKKNDKTSKLHLELLFDDAITSEYTTMIHYFNNWRNAHHDLDVYSGIIEVMDGEGGYTSPMSELMDAEQTLNLLECPDDKILANFEALCDKYQITYSETKEPEDTKVYNYKDLSIKIVSTEREYKNQKKKLLDLMQGFIKKSISPVTEKES